MCRYFTGILGSLFYCSVILSILCDRRVGWQYICSCNAAMVTRFDRATFDEYEQLTDGRLRIKATVSRTGELRYLRRDGGFQSEIVSPDELFRQDSLESAGGAPVTLGHPDAGMVTPATYKKYAVGQAGDRVFARRDTGLVDVVFVVGDEEAVAAIKSGKARQVSAGYTTELVEREDGIYQTNRKYNHFALVPQGRAGDRVAVHMDAAEDFAVQVEPDGGEPVVAEIQSTKGDLMKYKDMEMSQDAATFIKDMEAEVSKLKADMAKMSKKKDEADTETTVKLSEYTQVKARADMLDLEVSRLKAEAENKLDAAQVDQAVRSRLATWEQVKPFLGENAKFDITDTELAMKCKAIAAVHPKLSLDSRDEQYLNTAFEVLMASGLQKPATEATKQDHLKEALERARVGSGHDSPSLLTQDEAEATEAEQLRKDQAEVADLYRNRWKEAV